MIILTSHWYFEFTIQLPFIHIYFIFHVPFVIRAPTPWETPAKLNVELVRIWDEEDAIVESCDRSYDPPNPTAIILTPIALKDPATLDMSGSEDLPAMSTIKIRDRPAALPANSVDLDSLIAAAALQLPPISLTLAIAESTSEPEVY